MAQQETQLSKAALITGGAIRLGKALALGVARKGYDVILHYNSSEEAALSTCREIENLGVGCHCIQQDLESTEQLESLVERARDREPGLQLLINSASVYDAGSIVETTEEIFDRQMNVNLKAPFFLSRAFRKVVGQGSIVNILDNKIGFNQYHYAAYLLSKKMLAEFTRLASLEFAPDIRVNGISPGVILPATVRSAEYMAWRIEAIPLKRKGETEHIVRALHYLMENDFVSGQILTVDGAEGHSNVGRNAESYSAEES